MLRILPYNHPALRFESRPVTTIDEHLRSVVRKMFDLMYAAKGIGLAANQVGLPYRFFVLNITADPAIAAVFREYNKLKATKQQPTGEAQQATGAMRQARNAHGWPCAVDQCD